VAIMLHNLAEMAAEDGSYETAVTLYTHAEKIFRDLGSVYAGEAARGLCDLAEKMGRDQFDAHHRRADTTRWEDAAGI